METRDLFAAGASPMWVWTLFCEVPFPELTADDGVVRGTGDVICFFLAAARLDPALPADGLGDGLGTEGRILRFWKGAIRAGSLRFTILRLAIIATCDHSNLRS
jgi:hypothetical protein